jgi:hypothetical protein
LKIGFSGPYKIDTCYESGSVKIRKIDDENIPQVLFNGYRLKIYKKLFSREEFTTIMKFQQLNMVEINNSLNPFSLPIPI